MRTKTILFLILISLSLLFSGCFSDWKGDTGTITLNFDNNSQSRAAVFPPVENPATPNNLGGGGDYEVGFDEIEYEIIFSGHNEEFTLESKGKESVLAVVTPGRWEITVKAFIYETTTVTKRVMYAIGKETARVKPGQTTPVTVKMSNMANVNVYIDYQGGLTNYEVLKEYISYDIINVDKEDLILSNVKGRGPHRIEIPSGETYFRVDVYLNGTKFDSYVDPDVFFGFYGYTESIKINPGDNDVTILWSLNNGDYNYDDDLKTCYLINFDVVTEKGNPYACNGDNEMKTWVAVDEEIYIYPNPKDGYKFNYDGPYIGIINPDISTLPTSSPFTIESTNNKIKFKMPDLSGLLYEGVSITIKINYEVNE
jgi:hypothetical protein